jgi:formamidopyrimidine-DNA glycosylase
MGRSDEPPILPEARQLLSLRRRVTPMPEGPEVRRHADRLHAALAGKPIVALTARTREARAWLTTHAPRLVGRTVHEVRSHGKHLVGLIDGGFYFHSHLMMWGRWEVITGSPPDEVDRRERARIVTPAATAILRSAPIFDVGEGDPYKRIENLRSLGPDSLPYASDGSFDVTKFKRCLRLPDNRRRAIGAALLDQRIVAGLGNYLRAEVLFECRLDPWRTVERLTRQELQCICRAVPDVARRAYANGGITVTDPLRRRMLDDPTLTYRPGSDYGARHYVFRRTNLPCVLCGDIIRQLRQVTHANADGDEHTRITYFCPTCQGVRAADKRRANKRGVARPRAVQAR